MRNAPPLLRPPVLAASNIPVVTSTSGLGTGGGAGISCPDGETGYFDVRVFAGASPSSSGNVVITFPSTPPTMFFAAEQAFGTLTQTVNDNAITLAWTGASFSKNQSKFAQIHGEWSVSQ